jgi:phosphatidylserine decarboxylase
MGRWVARQLYLAPEGLAFVAPLAGVTLLCALGGWWFLGIIGGILTGGVGWFFRDPERIIPQDSRAVVAPADGRVMEIVPLSEGVTRLSIFLSIMDVHINRAPYGGKVTEIVYTAGTFLAAYCPEASLSNEANTITIEHLGRCFVVKQIAGVIARRIVCRVHPGDMLEKGQRYGLIRFGSRTDLLVPKEADIVVQVGNVVRGGETIVAFLKEP